MKVIYTPRCSKCRTLKKAFDENQVAWEKVLYLEGVLTREMIDEIFEAYKGDWRDLIRKKEAAFRENGVPLKELTQDQARQLVEEHPVILQRPIVLKAGEAYIARDDDTIACLL